MAITAGNLYALGATGGSASQTLAKNQIPSGLLTLNDPGHIHTITDPNHLHGITDPTHSHLEKWTGGSGSTSSPSGSGGQSNSGSTTSVVSTTSSSTGITVNSASTGITGANSNTTGVSLTDNGGSVPVQTLPPYLGLLQNDKGLVKKIFDLDGILEATLYPNKWVFLPMD